MRDWTDGQWPLAALWNRRHQVREARRLAREIQTWRREHADGRVILVAHSGGAGVALRALEALPAQEQVESVVLLSPAVSPNYDLTRALHRVSSRLTVFSSHHDGLVLGLGTFLVGTIDGAHGEAAGLYGFRRPPNGNRLAYGKLVHAPYRRAWLAYGNRGGHFGSCSKTFAAHVLAPLLRRPIVQSETPHAGILAAASAG